MPDPTPPVPALDASGRLSGWTFAVAAVAGTALLGDTVRLYAEGRSAPVSHLVAVPMLAFWIPAALVFGASLVVGVMALRGKLLGRLSRMPMLVLALIGFVDAFMLPDVRPPLSAFDVSLPLQVVGQGIEAQAEGGKLPVTVEELLPTVSAVGAPSLLVRGVRPAQWALVVRTDCTAAVDSAPGTAAGTMIYCVSADRRRAWLTAVAPTEERFGEASVARVNGSPLVQRIAASEGDAQPPSRSISPTSP